MIGSGNGSGTKSDKSQPVIGKLDVSRIRLSFEIPQQYVKSATFEMGVVLL